MLRILKIQCEILQSTYNVAIYRLSKHLVLIHTEMSFLWLLHHYNLTFQQLVIQDVCSSEYSIEIIIIDVLLHHNSFKSLGDILGANNCDLIRFRRNAIILFDLCNEIIRSGRIPFSQFFMISFYPWCLFWYSCLLNKMSVYLVKFTSLLAFDG